MKQASFTVMITLAAAALGFATAARAADLELELSGITQGQGQIMVAVFADAGSWLAKPVAVARAQAAEQKDGRLLISLNMLPVADAGSLALSIYHDVNGNGRLDKNGMGMPTEPYAFSNNASGMFGPPSFEKAQFSVKPGARISVQFN